MQEIGRKPNAQFFNSVKEYLYTVVFSLYLPMWKVCHLGQYWSCINPLRPPSKQVILFICSTLIQHKHGCCYDYLWIVAVIWLVFLEFLGYLAFLTLIKKWYCRIVSYLSSTLVSMPKLPAPLRPRGLKIWCGVVFCGSQKTSQSLYMLRFCELFSNMSQARSIKSL